MYIEPVTKRQQSTKGPNIAPSKPHHNIPPVMAMPVTKGVAQWEERHTLSAIGRTIACLKPDLHGDISSDIHVACHDYMHRNTQ
uniref:Uncharacterized protein n=1 Tax=Romanomermis culicivorax TaxID=13658 RepID=A0A915K1D3_ROMCU